MRRIAVIDSSCLINLAHLGFAPRLVQYFDLIYVPRKVQEEVNRKSKFRYRLNKLYGSGLFQRCASADHYRVKLLTDGSLDGGEAEGLVQAQEREATFFVADERRARAIAEKQGLISVGTVRLIGRICLEEFRFQGYAERTRSLVAKLKKDLRFRVDEDVVDTAIEHAPKPI